MKPSAFLFQSPSGFILVLPTALLKLLLLPTQLTQAHLQLNDLKDTKYTHTHSHVICSRVQEYNLCTLYNDEFAPVISPSVAKSRKHAFVGYLVLRLLQHSLKCSIFLVVSVILLGCSLELGTILLGCSLELGTQLFRLSVNSTKCFLEFLKLSRH